MSGLFPGPDALVTGVGRGIGRSIASALAAEGARPALLLRTEAELASVATDVAASRADRPPVFFADMRDPGRVREVARRDRGARPDRHPGWGRIIDVSSRIFAYPGGMIGSNA